MKIFIDLMIAFLVGAGCAICSDQLLDIQATLYLSECWSGSLAIGAGF